MDKFVAEVVEAVFAAVVVVVDDDDIDNEEWRIHGWINA